MHFFVHIGSHKTGTTSIQKALFSNRKALRDQGVLYPGLGEFNGGLNYAHHAIAHALAKFDDKSRRRLDKFHKRLSREVKNFDTVILSAEPFYRHQAIETGSKENDIGNLRAEYQSRVSEYFSDFSPEYTVYLRRPDSFAQSYYKEHLTRSGYQHGFDKFVSERRHLFQYQDRIQEFRNNLGPLKVYCFEQAAKTGLVKSFFEHHQLPKIKIDDTNNSRLGIGNRQALWLQYEKAANNMSKRNLRRRWIFALHNPNLDVFSDAHKCSFWKSHSARITFLGECTVGPHTEKFWSFPNESNPACTWSLIEHESAENSYKKWLKSKLGWILIRNALGIKPYESDKIGSKLASLAVNAKNLFRK